MKKSIIAAGAASVALAAMPVVGVFADYNFNNAVDNLRLVIDASCTFETGTRATSSSPIDLGPLSAGTGTGTTTGKKTGADMTISCNEVNGWTLKATASGLGQPQVLNADYTIPFGAYSESGSSVWSTAIAVSDATTGTYSIESGWDDFSADTASNTTILTSVDDTTTDANAIPVSGLKVTPSYAAYVDNTQEPGTYVGTMTYTFAVNAN